MTEVRFAYLGYDAQCAYRVLSPGRITWEVKVYRAQRFIGETNGEIPHGALPFAGMPVAYAVRRTVQQAIIDLYG